MSDSEPIRILVLHQDPVANAGLCATFLQYADFRVEECDDRTILEQCTADVIVADFASGMRAAALIEARDDARRKPGILVVAGRDREWQIKSAVEAGIRGYIVVGSALDPLAEGVRAVRRGSRYFSPQVASRLAESLSMEPLTTREEEVLRLVTLGLCNKAIGRQLDIAVGTVKSHLKSTFDKLNVRSRTQAVAAVDSRGLLGEPSHGESATRMVGVPSSAPTRFFPRADGVGQSLAGVH